MADVRDTNLETPGTTARNHHTELMRLMDDRAVEIPSEKVRTELEREGLAVPDPGTGKHRITVKGRRRINPND